MTLTRWERFLDSRFITAHPRLRWRLYGLGRALRGEVYSPRVGWQTRSNRRWQRR